MAPRPLSRRPPSRWLRALGRCDRGAALVEFAILLPVLLVVLATVFEGGRMLWGYQAVIAGVRDASRYLARATPTDICATGAAIGSRDAQLLQIVRAAQGGASVMPPNVTVTGISSSLTCVAGAWRVSPAPVATVTAAVTLTFPFGGVFSLFGAPVGPITTSVTDQARVAGS